jgi:hypothetical protein
MLLHAIFSKLSTAYQAVTKALFFFIVPICIDDFSFSDCVASNGMVTGKHQAAKSFRNMIFIIILF